MTRGYPLPPSPTQLSRIWWMGASEPSAHTCTPASPHRWAEPLVALCSAPQAFFPEPPRGPQRRQWGWGAPAPCLQPPAPQHPFLYSSITSSTGGRQGQEASLEPLGTQSLPIFLHLLSSPLPSISMLPLPLLLSLPSPPSPPAVCTPVFLHSHPPLPVLPAPAPSGLLTWALSSFLRTNFLFLFLIARAHSETHMVYVSSFSSHSSPALPVAVAQRAC